MESSALEPSPSDVPARGIHARRLRDLLRLAIADGQLADVRGRLPSETELMAEYRSSRTAVREALGLLCDEGLIARRRGLGTTRISAYEIVDLAVPGVEEAERYRPLAERIVPHVLHRGWMPAPRVIASRLDRVSEGDPCLALEYVLTFTGDAIAVITNYVREQEASRLEALAFRSDFYGFLLDGGITMSGQGATLQPRLADVSVATILDVELGSPVMSFEQVIRDEHGEVIDVALGSFRGDVRLRGVGLDERREQPRSVSAAR